MRAGPLPFFAMHLHQQLIAETDNSTLSILSKAGKFVCFVLEDGYREKKVMHQTRIPPGTYAIRQRKYGKFYDQYSKLWRLAFISELADVPGFTDILIHPGNTVNDTSGCLLTGHGVAIDPKTGNFYITEKKSSPAFLLLHGLIAEAFAKGEAVTLAVSRELIMTGNPSYPVF